MTSPRVRLVALGLFALASAGSCRCDSFRFYEVTRSFVDQCDILPQGEFCDEEGEQLPAPVFEIWAIEHRAQETRVVVDEEVWIADPQDPEQPTFIRASKLEVATVEPGPCTTTRTRSFVIEETTAVDPASGATVEAILGNMAEKTRLTGPDDCGETPRGERTEAGIVGLVAGAP